jgi:hypothetical protein
LGYEIESIHALDCGANRASAHQAGEHELEIDMNPSTTDTTRDWASLLHTNGWRLLGATVAGLALVACGGGSDDARPGAGGPTAAEATQLVASVMSLPAQTLDTSESDGLVWVREEEKLAHDVYAVAAVRWGLKVFTNIGASEVMHMDVMKALLERYALADPNLGLAAGSFRRPEFQALYDALLRQTDTSLIDALQVGLQIEELDILDIEREKTRTDNLDIRYAYDELLRGSRNHLRAFWRQLQQQGGSYSPQHITQAAFDTIANSATETAPTALLAVGAP